MEKIPAKRMDELMAELVINRVGDARSLLEKNGFSTANLSDQETQIAFLKAIKDGGAPFRESVASYMSDMVKSLQFVSQPGFPFVSQPAMQDFVSQPMLHFNETTPESSAGASSSSKSGGGFWNALGSLASKENLQNLFNTGLTIASTSLQNKSNKESEQRALELERIRLEQIKEQTKLAAAGGNKKGLSTGAWIGIGVGAIAVTVLIVVLVKRK